MLIGSYTATIDDKSRLRLPARFRRDLPETLDNTYYITSYTGTCAKIYPLPVWERIAQKFLESPRMHPLKVKLQKITSYYGSLSEMDPQGRILLPADLREDAQLSGDVRVSGQYDHLEVWNEQNLRKDVRDALLTPEEWEKAAEMGF